MRNEIIPYDLILKLFPGVAHRLDVIEHLGIPKVVSFGQDYKVIYEYPTEGIEVSIRIGENATLSIVKAVVLKQPFKDTNRKSLEIGMAFPKAVAICNAAYEFELDTGNSRMYSLGDPKLNLQIWNENGRLGKIEFF